MLDARSRCCSVNSRSFPTYPHLNKLKVGCHLEMALQTRRRIGNDTDKGTVHTLVDSIESLENEGVGADETLKIQGIVFTFEASGDFAPAIVKKLTVSRCAIDGVVLKGVNAPLISVSQVDEGNATLINGERISVWRAAKSGRSISPFNSGVS